MVAAVGTSATLAGLLGVMAIAWNVHRAAPGSPSFKSSTGSSTATLGASTVVLPAPSFAAQSIAVHAVPADAHISRDGVDLGPSPVEVSLKEGESATLVVTRGGYKARTVRVEFGDGVQTVALELAAAPPAAASVSRRGTPKATDGFDDVGDPFTESK